MNSPKNPLEFSFSKLRYSSLKHSNSLRTNSDPFAILLHYGNKLKPVSPKMLIPKKPHCLPPRPHQKENSNSSELSQYPLRIETPCFQAIHSKNSGSLCDLKKLNKSKNPVQEIRESLKILTQAIPVTTIRRKNIRST